jgi:hypothetical protein
MTEKAYDDMIKTIEEGTANKETPQDTDKQTEEAA